MEWEIEYQPGFSCKGVQGVACTAAVRWRRGLAGYGREWACDEHADGRDAGAVLKGADRRSHP